MFHARGVKSVRTRPWLPCSPVDDVKAKSSTLLYHVSEMLVELRGSSGNVQGRDSWAVFDYLDRRDGNVVDVGALRSEDGYLPLGVGCRQT